MRVELIAYTNKGEGWNESDHVCDVAAKTCVSEHIPDMVTLDDDYPEWTDPECRSLRHALASGHESVAEHASFVYTVEGVSRVTEIQLVRHRLASYSIQSGRYCTRDPTYYVMPFDPTGIDDSVFEDFDRALLELDARLKEKGVSTEDRRYFYPQGLKTNLVVTVNARELRHMASERMCARAQWEIRELVTEMVRLAKKAAPVLFADAGPKCDRLGYCPERRGSCGRHPAKGDGA